MNERNRVPIIYLDSAIHFDAMKGNIDLSALRTHSVRVAFSEAHFNDASGGGILGISELATYIQGWPNAAYIAAPHRIPALEFREFIRARPSVPDAVPSVVFDNRESLGAVLDELDGPNLSAITPERLEAILRENEENKRILAHAMTYAKRGRAEDIRGGRKVTGVQRAESIIRNASRLDDEAREAVERTIALGSELPATFGPGTNAIRGEILTLLSRMQTAGLDGDADAIQTILADAGRLRPAMAANPLLSPTLVGSPEEQFRWLSFLKNCIGQAGLLLTELSPDDIRSIYAQMVANPELCPSWTLLAEVELRMVSDAETVAEPSDQVDLNHLAALPYVDEIFLDARIESYVCQNRRVSPINKAKCHRTSTLGAWLVSLQSTG